jgi:hypothetical protein
LSVWGTGKSEYSVVCKGFIEGRLEAFCSLKEINEEALWEFRKSFQLVRKWALWFQGAPLAYHLRRLGDGEPGTEKAVRLHKEAIFWFSVEMAWESFNHEDRKWIYEEIYKMRRRRQRAFIE